MLPPHNQNWKLRICHPCYSDTYNCKSGSVSCMQTLFYTIVIAWNVSIGKVDSYLRNKTIVEKRRRHFIPIIVVEPRNVIFSTMYLFLFVFSNEKKMSRHIMTRIDVWATSTRPHLSGKGGRKK